MAIMKVVLFNILLAMSVLLVWIPSVAAAGEPVQSLFERRSANLVRQNFDISCGAAALATILNFQHGEDVTERQVALGLIARHEYIESPELLRMRQGFSLLDLRRYVQSLGYRGIGFGHMKFADLVEHAPVIVPINPLGYNHFVVFRGVLRNRVLLGDPAYGNRTMTVDRFRGTWIKFPKIGRVGFVVQRRDGLIPPSVLTPDPNEFLTFQ
jgi:hypothetical protein